jgi:hypothetical protein
MKTYGEVKLQNHAIITSELDARRWPASEWFYSRKSLLISAELKDGGRGMKGNKRAPVPSV